MVGGQIHAEAQVDAIKKIENVCHELMLSEDDYRQIMNLLHNEMNKGLSKEMHDTADVKMFQTFIRSLPDGTEDGSFLALDLSGQSFRVLYLTLHPGGETKVEHKTFLIPQSIMTGKGEQLFDHVATCIEKFVKDRGIPEGELPLGFMFPFRVRKTGLASATLLAWGKGFQCSGVVGEDVVSLLQQSLNKLQGIRVKVVAIMNDTVATQMSCAHADKNCLIGLILSKGINACYLEKLENVQCWEGDHNEPKTVIVNTEWGAFGSNGVIDQFRTGFDKELDLNSSNPGHQIFEKMISGEHLGEIVRLIMMRLVNEKLLFNGAVSEELLTANKFHTKYLSEIEGDTKMKEDYRITRMVLHEVGLDDVTSEDCAHVQYVCSVVSTRAAYLISAALAVLLNRIGQAEVTIAVDGPLYRFHPKFHDRMMDKINQLVNTDILFTIKQGDRHGKGSALVAAVAHRILSQGH
ncbi:unnamed protein product [Owenia fusiformis]|uniref:Phosphotransferase n=1 Tax=Owenia fusiformis TaxID=6347 RepID=A0A8J1TXZ0_OWEFU|nr:unnamed protein product [Owenia fusiformis]